MVSGIVIEIFASDQVLHVESRVSGTEEEFEDVLESLTAQEELLHLGRDLQGLENRGRSTTFFCIAVISTYREIRAALNESKRQTRITQYFKH